MDEKVKKALEMAKKLEKEEIPSDEELKRQDEEFKNEAKELDEILGETDHRQKKKK